MIDVICEFVEIVMNWAESCPCHWHHSGELQGYQRHDPRRRMGRARRASRKRCPLAGMQAPECAAGAILELMETLWNVSHAHLLLHPDMAALSAEDRAEILEEFGKGRKHIFFYIRFKI